MSNWKLASLNPSEIGKEVLCRVMENGERKHFVSSRKDNNYWEGFGRDAKGIVEWTEIPE